MARNQVPTQAKIKSWYHRWQKGESLSQIAREEGISNEGIQYHFKRAGFSLAVVNKCILPECGKVFTTLRKHRLACCRRHLRRAASMRSRNHTVSARECALPECTVSVWVSHKIGDTRKTFRGGKSPFCCKSHRDLHQRRIKSGLYSRLRTQLPTCEICGEWRVVDCHHEVFDQRTGSDLSGPTHHLCPTHHMLIHRGLASYKDGEYREHIDGILEGIERKIASRTWLEAKG